MTIKELLATIKSLPAEGKVFLLLAPAGLWSFLFIGVIL